MFPTYQSSQNHLSHLQTSHVESQLCTFVYVLTFPEMYSFGICPLLKCVYIYIHI